MGRSRLGCAIVLFMLSCPALLVITSALAQEPEAAPQTVSLLFQIYDADALLSSAPQVTLTDAAGEVFTFSPRDDGQLPDFQAGDQLYSQPVMGLMPPALSLTITDGVTSWSGTGSISAEDSFPMMVASLQPDATLQISDAPLLSLAHGEKSILPEVSDSEVRVQLGYGYWLWAVGLAGLGVGLAASMVRVRRAASSPARLDVVPTTAAVKRIPAAALAETCAALCAQHRVVLLGPPTPETIACLDERPLPGELVGAIEALALSPGPSPALVVADAARLAPVGRQDPVALLLSLVAGRFPVVLVE